MHFSQQDKYSVIRNRTKGGSEMFQNLSKAGAYYLLFLRGGSAERIWQWYSIPMVARVPSSSLQNRC